MRVIQTVGNADDKVCVHEHIFSKAPIYPVSREDRPIA